MPRSAGQCWQQHCGQLSDCRQGEPIRQLGPALVFTVTGVRTSLFTLCCWAKCTPLMLNDYRQIAFCSGLWFWTGACKTLSSPVPSRRPLRDSSHTGYRLLTRMDCTRRRERRTPPKSSADCFPHPYHVPWGPVLQWCCLLHSQLCSTLLFPACCKKTSQFLQGNFPGKVISVYKPAVDLSYKPAADLSWSLNPEVCDVGS